MEAGDKLYKQDYTDEEFIALQKKWSDYSIANNCYLEEGEDEEKGYYLVLNAPTIDDKIEQKLNQLRRSFNTAVSGSFTTSQGYLMQFNETDCNKLNGSIELLTKQGATEGYLTQADDTTVYNVSLETMTDVLYEMLATYAACHAKKQVYRDSIKACSTQDELDAITFEWLS